MFFLFHPPSFFSSPKHQQPAKLASPLCSSFSLVLLLALPIPPMPPMGQDPANIRATKSAQKLPEARTILLHCENIPPLLFLSAKTRERERGALGWTLLCESVLCALESIWRNKIQQQQQQQQGRLGRAEPVFGGQKLKAHSFGLSNLCLEECFLRKTLARLLLSAVCTPFHLSIKMRQEKEEEEARETKPKGEHIFPLLLLLLGRLFAPFRLHIPDASNQAPLRASLFFSSLSPSCSTLRRPSPHQIGCKFPNFLPPLSNNDNNNNNLCT